MTNTRDSLYRRFIKRIVTDTPRTGHGQEREPTSAGHQSREGSSKFGANEYSIDKAYSPDIDNEGPNRQIISRMPTKGQRKFRQAGRISNKFIILISRTRATVWQLRPWREKTDIEKEQEAEIKKRQKMRRMLRRESAEFARRASNAYYRMGLAYTPPLQARSFINGVKKVTFSNVVAERNAIWLQIATDKLPYGVSILSCIEDVGILTNLSASLRHHVLGVYDVEKGAWLCIERGRGVRGIPKMVTYEKMKLLMPKGAHPLTIPLGETVNSKRLYRNLRDFPHMLIAGSTGQGKTSYLNVILAVLIENNTPENLKIVLVDLKNGIEFDMYRGIPHLWKMGGEKDAQGNEIPESDQIAPEGIVGRSDKVIKLLYRLRREGERRLHRFRESKVTNINEYNRGRTKSRMNRIVIMIDEWARVALSPDGTKADEILSEITATYRAVGFHVILATQTPITRVISTLIKTNFNARLAFGVPSNVASMVILDTGRARALETVGRSIFQYGTQVVETQVPFIPKKELLAILAEARQDGGAVELETSMLEIFRYALNSLDGSLAVQRIYEQFSETIGRNDLVEKLKAMDDLLVDVDGVEYVIMPGHSNIPRMIIPFKAKNVEGEDEPIPPHVAVKA